MMRAAATACWILLVIAACHVDGWTPDQRIGVRSACNAHRVRAVGSTPTTGNGAAAPTCRAADDGALGLSYMSTTCVEPRGFRGCQVGTMFDVSAFETGDGVWQAEICLDGSLIDTVNLWYETQGTRKYLNLLQPGAAAGCHTVFFAASDACLSADVCGPLCAGGTTVALPDASASTEDAAVPPDAGAGDPDAGTDANGGGVLACSAFSSVSLTLMSEWCVCPAGGCPAQTAVDLRLASLSYLSAGCLCQHDADCDVGTVCRKDAWPESAHCRATPAGCPGVCVP